MSLFTELKQRNVFRVAAAYTVTAWMVVQIADITLENIGAPLWIMQSIMLVLGIGFVFAVIISWAFEITADGIKRESEIVRDEAVTEVTAKRLDLVTIGLLIVAIGLLGFDRLLREPGVEVADADVRDVADSKINSTTDTTTAPDRSIAVLPFIAYSSNNDDAFFGRGIAEELLNALAQVPDLKVAARTSAFSFVEDEVDLRQVGDLLGVAHILEGSVRRSGDRLRVTAQLIRAADGFHLWSKSYERRLADFFDIQDEIVAEISRVLQIRLGVGAGRGRANHTLNPQAYELYLQALTLWGTRESSENRMAAIQMFRRVTELDPGFADGWAAYGVSMAFSDVGFVEHLAPAEIVAEVSKSFARALDTEPDNPRALAGLVFWHSQRQYDIVAANRYLERALTTAPNYGLTNYAAAQFYFMVGDKRQANAAINRALLADPLNPTLMRIQFQHDAAFGHFDSSSSFLSKLPVCSERICTVSDWRWTFSAFTAALHVADESYVRRYRERFEAVFQALEMAPEPLQVTHQMLMAHAATVLGEPNVRDSEGDAKLQPRAPASHYLLDAIVMAEQGRLEEALTLIEQIAKGGRLFASRGVLYSLWPGRLEVPEQLRRNPRYHKVWTLPGMPEIELARRSNGQTAGLPL